MFLTHSLMITEWIIFDVFFFDFNAILFWNILQLSIPLYFSLDTQDLTARLLWCALFQLQNLLNLKGSNSFLFSFIQLNLLSTYYILGMLRKMILGYGDIASNKTNKNLCSHRAYILVKGTNNKQVNKYINYFHIMIRKQEKIAIG